MSACSFRARFSVSPTTTSVAPIRRAVSANANQRAAIVGIVGATVYVPLSSGGRVGRGAEVAGFFTSCLRCQKGELPFDTELCVLRPRYPVEILVEVVYTVQFPRFELENGTQRSMSKKSESHK